MIRVFDRWFFLALIVSTGPVLVLSHGILGTGSIFTGGFIAISTVAVFLFSRWRDFYLDPCDALFVLFISCVALSFGLNGETTNIKEIQLFGLSIAAYPACRLFSSGGIKPTFAWVTAILVATGTIVTGVALFDQWSDDHGRPMVFGQFDAAPTQFLASLGFLIIASVCTGLTARRSIVISVIIFVPTAIFAASMVRFAFIGIVGSLVIAALIGPPNERKYVALVALAILAAVASGLLARSATTMKFITHEINSISTPLIAVDAGLAKPTPVVETKKCTDIDLDNSIQIRKQLFREAIDQIPSAGFFGIGLDGFMRTSCIKGTEIHNSLLQAVVEFGWLGGTAFCLLIIIGGGFLLSSARYDPEVRFVLCNLAYVLLLSMAYGRLSHDALLFLFLGYAASLKNRLTNTLHRTLMRHDTALTYWPQPAENSAVERA